MKRYNSFGSYIKKRFGSKVFKVNVDAGFTCPNRDGTLGVGGCIYCNNDSFRPSSCKPALSVQEQVRNGISYLRGRYKAEKFIAYFQPYSNTYAPIDVLERLYSEALEEPSVVGLAIGTRPDCIDEEKLDMLQGLLSNKFILMEYGIQSIYEKTLKFINRCHDYHTFLKALEMTKKRGLHAGAHVIVGFPTETKDEMLHMADVVSQAGIEFLKIHQLQVVQRTKLASMYEKEQFHVFGYEEYLNFIVDFIGRLSPEIVIQRLFATAPDEILIAPRWGKSRSEILRDIEKRFIERDTYQGKRYAVTQEVIL
ncbi:MAG: TIGR01212 family radical SAM protein [Nitrospirae bacterium]|nr:TIGR01212 family radical SAM protein [Nitrospirota bacterium]